MHLSNLPHFSAGIRSGLYAMALAILLSGCYKDPGLQEISDVRFESVKDSILFARIAVVVHNPNGMGVSIRSQEADVYIEGMNVGKTKSGQAFKLKGKDTTSIVLDSEINLNTFAKIFPGILKQESALVSVDGRYSVDAGISAIKIRSKTESRVNVRQELDRLLSRSLSEQGIRVKKITPRKMGIDSTSMAIELAVANQFPFEYELTELDFDLFFGNSKQPFGKWKLSEPVAVAAKSSELLKGQVDVRNTSVFSSGLGGIFGKKTVRATGEASLSIAGKAFRIPLDQEIPLSSALPFGN